MTHPTVGLSVIDAVLRFRLVIDDPSTENPTPSSAHRHTKTQLFHYFIIIVDKHGDT